MRLLIMTASLLALPAAALASSSVPAADLTRTVYGYLGIAIFVLAYSLVPLENTIHLRKIKPVRFAVLTMNPEMSYGQWLLVTLTAGVGRSMRSIGSAAGVALMGTTRGKYTFGAHLKWTPVMALGYAASIVCHLMINAGVM